MFLENFPICENSPLGTYNEPTVIDETALRCERIEVKFTKKQKAIIVKWFDVYRWAYNIAVKYIRDEIHRKLPMTLNFINLRALLRSKYANQIENYKKKTKIPLHTINEAFNDVVKAYDTSFALLRNKKIKHFRLRYKRREKPLQTLCLEALCFEGKKVGEERVKRNNTFCPSVFGTYIATSKSIKNVVHACRLTWNRHKNIFILHVPVDRQIKHIDREEYCSLDPGIRTFMTLYDGSRTTDFGVKEPKQIKELLTRMDKLKRFKGKRWYKKFCNRINARIQGIRDDLHWKTALDLVRRYDNILIGNMSTIGIVRRDTSKLSAMTKRICYALSHFTFKLRLKAKAEEYDSCVNIIDEHYTSQTCGVCRHRHRKLGGAHVYKCPQTSCDFVWGRDQNGARNIALKHFGLFNPIM
jgi:transposase